MDLNDPVQGALRDADVLIAFAAQSHRSIEREKIEALTSAVDAVAAARAAGQRPGAAEMAALWTAYDSLAVDMAPLSAHSIRSSIKVHMTRFPASLASPMAYHAIFAVVVFLICIGLQGFWVAGKELVDQVERLEVQRANQRLRSASHAITTQRSQAKVEALRLKLCTIVDCNGTLTPRQPVGRNNREALSVDAELTTARSDRSDAAITGDELRGELARLNENARPLEQVLRDWHNHARRVCSISLLKLLCPARNPIDRSGPIVTELTGIADERRQIARTRTDPTVVADKRSQLLAREFELRSREEELLLEEAEQLRSVVVEARITLANIGTYLIAMVMGILGSLAFIMRGMSQQLREHTYVPVSFSISIVRVCLGAIAGVFGSLFTPGAELGLQSLPPLFVPFAFGYGIEILFSLLDRVVRTFTQGEVEGQQVTTT